MPKSCKLAVVLNGWVGDPFVGLHKKKWIHSNGLQARAENPVYLKFCYYFVKQQQQQKGHMLFITEYSSL